jgi:hypothetical protein
MAIWHVCIFMLWPFGIYFYRRLVIYIVDIWYIFPSLVHCVKKNLATVRMRVPRLERYVLVRILRRAKTLATDFILFYWFADVLS